MTLGELALTVDWGFGLILDETAVKNQAVRAARHYLTWGDFAAEPLGDLDCVDDNLDVTASEWGIIQPLVSLYVERENARALEASRGLGVDVYGRAVSEVEQAIAQYEAVDLPRAAFAQLPESI